MSYNDGRRRDRSRSRERDSGAYGGGPPPVPPGAYAGGMRQGAIANLPQLPAFATAGSVSDDRKTKGDPTIRQRENWCKTMGSEVMAPHRIPFCCCSLHVASIYPPC